ncbi:MAG: excinuclease ABC subunit UvrA [Actinobacteria bacterium]|nr:MAG: excinuclease ABC subunit UvrA [Actinomycetota bacterium]TMK93927.1 MAG: excinuclease ABC subunit UvrA [Actinomycetota bacterium]
MCHAAQAYAVVWPWCLKTPVHSADVGQDSLVIHGAREHNLRNITLELPRDALIVFTGLSGSGKSSLAFDTIYAEGQRRYVESLSSYARQFLGQMEKPDVDFIEGLSPAISIDQKSTSRNPRSTVGTITEVYDYLRVLFARVGRPHCFNCGRPIGRQTPEQIVDQVMELPEGTRFQVLAPVVRGRKGEYEKLLQDLARKGYPRARIDGEVRDLAEPIRLPRNYKHTIEVVVDRLVAKPDIRRRVADSIEQALELAEGIASVAVVTHEGHEEVQTFSQKLACTYCGLSFDELAPRNFSFNSPYGACPTCDGLGTRLEVDPELVVPEPDLSINEGAIAPWASSSLEYWYRVLQAVGDAHGFDLDTPWKKLPKKARDILLDGSEESIYVKYKNRYGRQRAYWTTFEGILPNIERRYRETESDAAREKLEQFMREIPCRACRGQRLRPETLAVTIGDRNIADVTDLSIRDALAFTGDMGLSEREEMIAARLVKEIRARLGFLVDVGLDYLTLGRAAGTLAGGEAQRIRLATQIGSGLVGVLYILDEPSIGLHQRDNRRLLDTLIRLRDLGNTLIVVEHDEATIVAADHIVDIGPGAGEHGGEIVYSGELKGLLEADASLTGAYLSGRRTIPVPEVRRQPGERVLRMEGVREHNLQNVNVQIPLGLLVCVTGVSGSGKSTLVQDVLLRALMQKVYRSRLLPGRHKKLIGWEQVDKVIDIDQSPIGRTPRSNPATYTGVFDHVRKLYAQVPEARIRGFQPGRFSFNVRGGRCENCAGDGQIKIEMHFLPDVYVTCEVCKGRRYNRETLEVKYKGRSISDVLAMSVDEALEFFQNIPPIKRQMETLSDVGLGYIKLGQPAPTLSGGEAQRIKLASELHKRATGNTLYVLDEPTTGLHFEDIRKLLQVLQRLVSAGNTVLVIEHNLDVVKTADWIVDLGPEGGDQGGKVVAVGTPEEVAADPDSHTGRFLAEVLGSLPLTVAGAARGSTTR